jgi:hypothetical protein
LASEVLAPRLLALLHQSSGRRASGTSNYSFVDVGSQTLFIFFREISERQGLKYLSGTVHFIADALEELPSPVRASIWLPPERYRDTQPTPLESSLPPVVVQRHLEDLALAEALPV